MIKIKKRSKSKRRKMNIWNLDLSILTRLLHIDLPSVNENASHTNDKAMSIEQ